MEKMKFYIWCPACEKFHELNELRMVERDKIDRRYFCPQSPRNSEAFELAFLEVDK